MLEPGVRPSISLASSPTAMNMATAFAHSAIATTDGSFKNDAAAFHINQSVGCAEIDRHVGGHPAEECSKHTFPLDPASLLSQSAEAR